MINATNIMFNEIISVLDVDENRYLGIFYQYSTNFYIKDIIFYLIVPLIFVLIVRLSYLQLKLQIYYFTTPL